MGGFRITRLIHIAVSALMLIVLAACGTATDEQDPTPTATAEPTPAVSETPIPDFDAAAYFSGKTIRLVICCSPGGGTDASARYLAAAWSKFIPGNPRIQVSNMVPGPTEMNYTWNAAPDGLTLAMDPTSAVGQQYFSQSVYKFDEFEFLGSFSTGDEAWLVSGNLPYNDIRDASGGTAKIIHPVAGSLPSELRGYDVQLTLLAHWLDLPLELVTLANANSRSVMWLSVERGETTSLASDLQWSRVPEIQPGWLEEGRIRLFADLSNPDLPFPGNSVVPADEVTAPNAADLVPAEYRDIYAASSGTSTVYSKSLLTTQGTPKHIVDVYRAAWDMAAKDAAFKEGLDRDIGTNVLIHSGEETQLAVKELVAKYAANRGELLDLMEEIAPNYLRN